MKIYSVFDFEMRKINGVYKIENGIIEYTACDLEAKGKKNWDSRYLNPGINHSHLSTLQHPMCTLEGRNN